MQFLGKTIRFTAWSIFAVFCGLVLISSSMYLYLSPVLPDVQTLKDFRLQTPMKVMSADNQLIAEYGEQRRTPINYDEIPVQFIQALTAIEDKRFEYHYGVDPIRFTRVVIDLLATGNKEGAGGSTLTQQVARNYFLSQQKTFTRKFTEILLALKMESELSKEDIFELYINKHFLGYNSYGIQAAAAVYYGKDINDLELPELAMIAGLHQLPSLANPLANPERAKRRRNAVLTAMHGNGYLSTHSYNEAIKAPVTAKYHGNNPDFEAWYLAEMVRSEMLDRFSETAYTDGYTVYTTVNSELQKAANQGVRNALINYSKRHGYLGPEQHLIGSSSDTYAGIMDQIEQLYDIPAFGSLIPALVLSGDASGLQIIPKGAEKPVFLSLESMAWARERISVDRLGPEITHGYQVASPGDVVRVRALNDTQWELSQIPRAQGALVALSPTDGSVQSLVGGFDYFLNKYNRAVQAARQPGSNFKPFIYAAALDKGYTPATIVNDAPIVRSDDVLEDIWRPKNSGDRYLGPIPLRQALYQSRNLSSIRVLDDIGVGYARQYLSRFGFNSAELANDMTLILGTTAMSPLEIAQGYAVIANGGYAVEPYFIDRIEDKDGNIIFETQPITVCRGCPEATYNEDGEELVTASIDITPLTLNLDSNQSEPTISSSESVAERVISPQTIFLLDSMLKDVVIRGTARSARNDLPRGDIAGKTGTTNDAVDAWFTGYNGDYVVSTWVGYDSHESLGASEYGGKAALPAWVEFMTTALKNKPENSLPQPVGIVQLKIDPESGLLAGSQAQNAVFEYFDETTAPSEISQDSLIIDFSVDATEEESAESPEPGSALDTLF